MLEVIVNKLLTSLVVLHDVGPSIPNTKYADAQNIIL